MYACHKCRIFYISNFNNIALGRCPYPTPESTSHDPLPKGYRALYHAPYHGPLSRPPIMAPYHGPLSWPPIMASITNAPMPGSVQYYEQIAKTILKAR